MKRRHLLITLGAGVAVVLASAIQRSGSNVSGLLLTPAASRIRRELGSERCRELLASVAADPAKRTDPVDLASRIEADLRAARILFVNNQPCTHTELALTLSRDGRSRP
jgi:hypothetical protein